MRTHHASLLLVLVAAAAVEGQQRKAVQREPGLVELRIAEPTGERVQTRWLALKPTDLVYNDERGDTASATLPAVPTPSVACQTYDGWFKPQPSSACLTCIENADGVNDASGAACESAARAYGNSCGACQSKCLPFSNVDLCACELSCDNPSCQMLWNTYVSCVVSNCEAHC